MKSSFIPNGYCIYCRKKEDRMTKEHVLPVGLGGKEPPGKHGAVVLQNASCKNCQSITRKLEGDWLRSIEGIKNRLGLTGASVGKDTELKSDVISFPILSSPGWLDRVENLTSDDSIMCPYFTKMLGQQDIWFFDTPSAPPRGELYDVVKFSRVLAKMAHGFALNRFGFEQLDCFLPDFILGLDSSGFNFIGGLGSSGFSEPEISDLHRINIITELPVNKLRLVVVYIRLFARYGAPTYKIIAGRYIPQLRYWNPAKATFLKAHPNR